MSLTFANRRAAGWALGHQMAQRGYFGALVLALPRGGVPVGFEVARALQAPLDVFVVRKLGVPGREELAMGAVASGGTRILLPDVILAEGIGAEAIESVTRSELRELTRREIAYRGAHPFLDVRGHQVIVVDDGVATGASMIAAVRAIRTLAPEAIIVATPVASAQATRALGAVAERCEVLEQPQPFLGVGLYYDDFSQTSDEEVRELLAASSPTVTPGNGHLVTLPGGKQ